MLLLRTLNITFCCYYGLAYLIRSFGSFAEIIPQSVCTRHGLYVGAKMVGFVRVLLWTLVR